MKSFFTASLLTTLLLLLAVAPAESGKWKLTRKASAIVDAKCYSCHSEESHSARAKIKLHWDELAGASTDLQLEKLESIEVVLAERSMPPFGFLENNPEMALTDDEIQILEKWIGKQRKKLSK